MTNIISNKLNLTQQLPYLACVQTGVALAQVSPRVQLVLLVGKLAPDALCYVLVAGLEGEAEGLVVS